MEGWVIAVIVVAIILAIAIAILISNIKVIGQTEKGIVEHFGAYKKTWGTGIHILVPWSSPRITSR